MAPDSPSDDRPPEEELEELQDKKEDEVLEREPVEQELMQTGQSHVGEDLDSVQEQEKDGKE